MSAATFIDTSILVATQDPNDPSQLHAVDRLELERKTGLPTLSANVLAEYFVALTKRRKGVASLMSHEAAGRRVANAAELNVVGVQPEHVLDALRLRERYQLQWWDALNVASAKAAGCNLFVTKDALSRPVIDGVRIEVLRDPPSAQEDD